MRSLCDDRDDGFVDSSLIRCPRFRNALSLYFSIDLDSITEYQRQLGGLYLFLSFSEELLFRALSFFLLLDLEIHLIKLIQAQFTC